MLRHKRTFLLSAVILLFCGILFSSLNLSVGSVSAATNDQIIVSSLSRTMKITPYGLAEVEDSYVFKNNATESIGSVKFGLTDYEMERLVYYYAENPQFGGMAIHALSEKLNNYNMFEIIFNQPLLANKTIDVNVQLVFKDLITLTDETTGDYLFQGYVIPISPYVIYGYTSEIKLPDASTLVNFSPAGAAADANPHTYSFSSHVPIFSALPANATYRNQAVTIMKLDKVNRDIRVNPLGYVTIVEENWLRNYGPVAQTSFVFEVPADTETIHASDDLGEIFGLSLAEALNPNGMKNVTFSLSVNRAPIIYKSVLYYKLEYTIPFESIITKNLQTNNFVIDLYTTKAPFIATEETIELEIMNAFSISFNSVEFDEEYATATTMNYKITNTMVTQYERQTISVNYLVNPFTLISRPLIFAIIFAAFMAVYVVLRTRQKANAPEEEEQVGSLPIREIREFVKLYEEKNAIALDTEKAEEDLSRRKIQKKAYNQTLKSFNDKVRELNNDIKPFKEILMTSDSKVQNILQQLDYLEAEKVSVRDSITLLEDRYKRGKLPSKAAYERLLNDLQKRTESIQKKLDMNINEMRAFLV